MNWVNSYYPLPEEDTELSEMVMPRGVFSMNGPSTQVLGRTKMPYEGRYNEVVSVEPLECNEYRIVERDKAHGTRIIWVNKETGIIMVEIGDTK